MHRIKKIFQQISKVLYVMANFFREEKQQLQEEKQLLRLPTFYYLVYVKPLGF